MDARRYTLPRVPSEDQVNPVRWSDGNLGPRCGCLWLCSSCLPGQCLQCGRVMYSAVICDSSGVLPARKDKR